MYRQAFSNSQLEVAAAVGMLGLDLPCRVYFCDLHAPWQRGSNEKADRLLRH